MIVYTIFRNSRVDMLYNYFQNDLNCFYRKIEFNFAGIMTRLSQFLYRNCRGCKSTC